MSGGTESIEALFAGGGPAKPRKRGRGWIVAAWIVGGLIVLLGVAFFLVDNGLRAAAEKVAQSEIEQRLPDTVTGKVDVKIGGGSVILQYLSGSFNRVDLDAPSLDVNGVPVAAHVVVKGVSTDFTAPIKDVSGVINLNQTALNAMMKVPGATSGLTLGTGTLSFAGTQAFLGTKVSYLVTAKPKAAGANVLLTPTDVKITAGSAGADLTPVITAILGEKPLPVCVAQFLPKGVDVTKISVTPKTAAITLDAQGLTLSESALSTKGVCPG